MASHLDRGIGGEKENDCWGALYVCNEVDTSPSRRRRRLSASCPIGRRPGSAIAFSLSLDDPLLFSRLALVSLLKWTSRVPTSWPSQPRLAKETTSRAGCLYNHLLILYGEGHTDQRETSQLLLLLLLFRLLFLQMTSRLLSRDDPPTRRRRLVFIFLSNQMTFLFPPLKTDNYNQIEKKIKIQPDY